MKRLVQKAQATQQRKTRVRKSLRSKQPRIRLSVYISNKNVIAQLIDDSKDKTIGYVSTIGSKAESKSMTDKAVWVGAQIAEKAKQAKVKQVAFDRGSKLYHGRIKALAEEARKGGLEF